MKISKNDSGGYTLDGQADLVLTKRDYLIDNNHLDNSVIKNLYGFFSCSEYKIRALWFVIKWLLK